MLNLTSIKSGGEEELKTYKMVINFKPGMQRADYILRDSVTQGIVLEYVYSHDCSLIPIKPLNNFYEVTLTFDSVGYTYKTDLATLEDIAEHIRFLVGDVDSVTIYPIDAKEN